MKSYIQGLITGAVFVFALMVLMGATGSKSEIGRYLPMSTEYDRESILDTTDGRLYVTLQIATFDYQSKFTCAVNKDNIYGTQFHPEKSHETGFNVLINFIKYA